MFCYYKIYLLSSYLLLVQGANFTGSLVLDIGIADDYFASDVISRLVGTASYYCQKLFARFERVSEYVFLLALALVFRAGGAVQSVRFIF